jgi:hypothetical protein
MNKKEIIEQPEAKTFPISLVPSMGSEIIMMKKDPTAMPPHNRAVKRGDLTPLLCKTTQQTNVGIERKMVQSYPQ